MEPTEAPERTDLHLEREDESDVDLERGVESDEDVELVEEDLLVEEISIDGMCGVY